MQSLLYRFAAVPPFRLDSIQYFPVNIADTSQCPARFFEDVLQVRHTSTSVTQPVTTTILIVCSARLRRLAASYAWWHSSNPTIPSCWMACTSEAEAAYWGQFGTAAASTMTARYRNAKVSMHDLPSLCYERTPLWNGPKAPKRDCCLALWSSSEVDGLFITAKGFQHQDLQVSCAWQLWTNDQALQNYRLIHDSSGRSSIPWPSCITYWLRTNHKDERAHKLVKKFYSASNKKDVQDTFARQERWETLLRWQLALDEPLLKIQGINPSLLLCYSMATVS